MVMASDGFPKPKNQKPGRKTTIFATQTQPDPTPKMVPEPQPEVKFWLQ